MKQIAIAITCGFALVLTVALAPTVMLGPWDLEGRQNQHRVEARRLEEQAQQRALEQQQQRVLEEQQPLEARRLEQRVLEHQHRLEQQQLALEQQRLVEASRLDEQRQRWVLEHQQCLRLEEQQRLVEARRLEEQQQQRALGQRAFESGRSVEQQKRWDELEDSLVERPSF